MRILSLLPLLSWSTAAYAADGVVQSEVALSSTDEVRTYVGTVRQLVGGPVLLAAAGPEAERGALKVSAALGPGQVQVMRIGYIGDVDEEVTRALATTGLRCGIRIGATTAQTWTVSRHGDCSRAGLVPTPVAEAPAAVAPTASTPTASTPTASTPTASTPTASTPTASTPTAAPLVAEPAASAAAPNVVTPAISAPPAIGAAAPPPPPDPAVLASTYALASLRRVDSPNAHPELPDGAWAVRDGRGRTLTTAEFAKRTGDLGVVRRLEREQRGAKALGVGLAVGGGALVVAGLGVLLARDAGAPDWSDYEADPSDYRTNAQYFEAQAQAEADFRAADDAHGIRADDRAWIAGFLAGSGALTLGISPFAKLGVNDRQTVPAHYWDPAAADALIEAHNAAVRQSIGLPEPEAPGKAVIITRPAAPDEPEDAEDPPEDSEDPPEDALDPSTPRDEGAHQGPDLDHQDRAAPRPYPLTPDGRPSLSLTPVLGPAWAGLSGTF